MATSEALTDAVRTLLHEAIEGRAGGTTWFLDGDGLLATVRPLTAEQASRSLAAAGATVAGHVEHVRWFVALLNAFSRGERPRIDWSQSWTVREVDGVAWEALLAALERETDELDGHLAGGIDADDGQRLMPILATVVHAGYHVGAVRQLAPAVGG